MTASSFEHFFGTNGAHGILRPTGIAPEAMHFMSEIMAQVACLDRGRTDGASE